MRIYDEKNKAIPGFEPIFFGNRNIQRYDVFKYPSFDKYGEDMLENFWKKQEVPLLDDYNSFRNLLEKEDRVTRYNIRRQVVLDSVQGRALLLTLGRVLSNSEIEKSITILQQQEVNHSDTYSYILRNVMDDPSEEFESLFKDEMITRHTKSIKEPYEEAYDAVTDWEYLSRHSKDEKVIADAEYEMKKKLYKAIITWNIIEGIRFFVSFACSFSFAENGKMIGNAKELRLIARDELVHLKVSQKLINLLKTNPDEGFVEICAELEDEVIEMYKVACSEEIEWAEYLFEKGPLDNLNSKVLNKYMKHITNVRLRAIKIPGLFPKEECEDLPFMDNWLSKKPVEELVNEIAASEYKTGMTVPVDWENIYNIYK